MKRFTMTIENLEPIEAVMLAQQICCNRSPFVIKVPYNNVCQTCTKLDGCIIMRDAIKRVSETWVPSEDDIAPIAEEFIKGCGFDISVKETNDVDTNLVES